MKLLALLPILVFLSGANAAPHPDVLDERRVKTKTTTQTQAGGSSPTSAPQPPRPFTVTRSGVTTVDFTGTYLVTCAGGSGGDAGSEDGGLAGIASGQFVLRKGTNYNVVIGQAGSDGSNRKTVAGQAGSGGGGGASSISFRQSGTTFVVLVAGGGGGASSNRPGGSNNGASSSIDAAGTPQSGNGAGGAGGGYDKMYGTAQSSNLGQGANGASVVADTGAQGFPGNGGAGGGGGGGAGATSGGGGGGGFQGGNGGNQYFASTAGASFIPDCSSAYGSDFTDYPSLAAKTSVTYYGAGSTGDGYCTFSYLNSKTTTCVGV